MGKRIIWTHQADAQLSQAFLDLLEESESVTITTKVITEIYESVQILSSQPEIYKLDELRRKNNGDIRAFEKHAYRISYQINDDKVYIIQIRYARKKPQKQ